MFKVGHRLKTTLEGDNIGYRAPPVARLRLTFPYGGCEVKRVWHPRISGRAMKLLLFHSSAQGRLVGEPRRIDFELVIDIEFVVFVIVSHSCLAPARQRLMPPGPTGSECASVGAWCRDESSSERTRFEAPMKAAERDGAAMVSLVLGGGDVSNGVHWRRSSASSEFSAGLRLLNGPPEDEAIRTNAGGARGREIGFEVRRQGHDQGSNRERFSQSQVAPTTPSQRAKEAPCQICKHVNI